MKPNRSAPVLLIVFTMLIGLIAISGMGALHRARETYRAVSTLNERSRRTDRVLNSIASGIYMVVLLARDYLLDPSNAHAAEYRSQLVAERSAMEKEFRELRTAIRDEDKSQLEKLQGEVEGYWDALDPLFEWTPEEKAARSSGSCDERSCPAGTPPSRSPAACAAGGWLVKNTRMRVDSLVSTLTYCQPKLVLTMGSAFNCVACRANWFRRKRRSESPFPSNFTMRSARC